ncbi:MAG: hypothetical protein ABI934_09695 [Actinomycetota bacterium]
MLNTAIPHAPLIGVVILGATLIVGGSSGAQEPPAGTLVHEPVTIAAARPWQSPDLLPRSYRQPTSRSLGTATRRSIATAAAKRPATKTVAQAVRGPTSWSQLNQAIARIPGYRNGVATWVVTGRYGHWGATDLANGTIYIAPNVPSSRLYAVAAHEYGHALVLSNYGGRQQSADLALSRWFGGGTSGARERAADCMAIAQGATWTSYTTCENQRWRQAALILLAGRRLP